MYLPEELLNDKDNTIRKAIAKVIVGNDLKEFCIDSLSDELSKQLEGYLYDGGNNVFLGFRDDIKEILMTYFGN